MVKPACVSRALWLAFSVVALSQNQFGSCEKAMGKVGQAIGLYSPVVLTWIGLRK